MRDRKLETGDLRDGDSLQGQVCRHFGQVVHDEVDQEHHRAVAQEQGKRADDAQDASRSDEESRPDAAGRQASAKVRLVPAQRAKRIKPPSIQGRGAPPGLGDAIDSRSAQGHELDVSALQPALQLVVLGEQVLGAVGADLGDVDILHVARRGLALNVGAGARRPAIVLHRGAVVVVGRPALSLLLILGANAKRVEYLGRCSRLP